MRIWIFCLLISLSCLFMYFLFAVFTLSLQLQLEVAIQDAFLQFMATILKGYQWVIIILLLLIVRFGKVLLYNHHTQKQLMILFSSASETPSGLNYKIQKWNLFCTKSVVQSTFLLESVCWFFASIQTSCLFNDNNKISKSVKWKWKPKTINNLSWKLHPVI